MFLPSRNSNSGTFHSHCGLKEALFPSELFPGTGLCGSSCPGRRDMCFARRGWHVLYGIFEQYVKIWKLLGTAVQGLSLVLWDIHWQTREIPGDHPHW